MRAAITGGGRGIGAAIASELVEAGWDVTVCARSQAELSEVGGRIGARTQVLDVTQETSVAAWARAIGEVDLLVANAGLNGDEPPVHSWEMAPAAWWQIFEVNVLGVHLCCRAVIPGMLERRRGRIVITASGAAHLPGGARTAYPSSKAAVVRYGEMLANELEGQIPVFSFDPGLVRTAMTRDAFGPDTAWASPNDAAKLVRRLAGGDHDALSGRLLHAHDDDLDALMAELDGVRERDLLTVRLRRP